MKLYIARNVLIAKLAALALLTLCFLQAQGRAQIVKELILLSPSAGLAPGQSLRFTLFNPDGTPVRAQAMLHDERGAVIAKSDETAIPAGAFHSFDFNRSDIPLAGEVGTGRLQLRATCVVRMAIPGKKIDEFAATLEIVEDGTGNTVLVGEVIPSPAGGSGDDVLKSGFGNDTFMIGIVPGQTLRINVFHPHDKGATSLKTVPVKVTIYDALSNVIAQTTGNAIPEGEFRSFDFNRSALHLPGEPGTGRLQVRAVVEGTFTLTFSRQTTSVPLSASWELVDNATGKTHLYNPNSAVFFLRNSNSP